MTTFTDGPAAGVTLLIRRTPLFLRVVLNAKGKWDAIDQLSDRANYDEAVYAYRKTADEGDGGGAFICRGGGAGGYFQFAKYAFIAEQPPEDVLRYNSRWQAW